LAIFDEKIEIRERCKGVHCVDLGESFPTSIYLQKSASIQPRTSPSKFGEKFNSLFTSLLRPVAVRAAGALLRAAAREALGRAFRRRLQLAQERVVLRGSHRGVAWRRAERAGVLLPHRDVVGGRDGAAYVRVLDLSLSRSEILSHSTSYCAAALAVAVAQLAALPVNSLQAAPPAAPLAA